jgi:hypothetical protein
MWGLLSLTSYAGKDSLANDKELETVMTKLEEEY